MSSKRKVKKIIQRLRRRNVRGLEQVKYYYKLGKYIHRHGDAPEDLDYKMYRGALRVYLYFRNQPLTLEPTYRKLRDMKERDFLQLLEDKKSSTGGTLSGTSYDLESHDLVLPNVDLGTFEDVINYVDQTYDDHLSQPSPTMPNLSQPSPTIPNLSQLDSTMPRHFQPDLTIPDPSQPSLIEPNYDQHFPNEPNNN